MDALEILKQLIQIPSENPGGSETRIVEFCRDLLVSHGVRHQIVAERDDRPNIIATVGDPSRGKTLIFQSHLDTKPAAHAGTRYEDWATDPFKPVEHDGIIYGLGACDTKGGAAAQLAALLEVATCSKELNGALIWQGVADEEHGSRYGAEVLLARGFLRGDAAVVAEPTNGVPTIQQVGNCWIDMRVSGTAAHGGTPWKGHDAIEAAMAAIAVMRERVAAIPKHPAFSVHPIVRIGLIEGGGHAGTVASACRVVTDIRVRPGQTREQFIELWRQAALQTEQALGVRITLGEFAGGGCEPHAVGETSNLARAVSDSWEFCHGKPMPERVFFGGSDARYFARAGTPAIVYGPGDLEHAHSPNERVPAAEVESTSRTLIGLTERLLSTSTQAAITR